MAKLSLRIFLSSPGDVGDERRMAVRVMERLTGEFSAVLDIDPIVWEYEPVRASSTFQNQIPEPAKADILVCILWSRLGTKLPGQFRRDDGTVYDSGTAYELETALAEFQRRGHPDILVYRKTAPPLFDVSNREERETRSKQWDQLADYLKNWFIDNDGTFKAGFTQFQRLDEFEDLLEKHLRRLIEERLKEAKIAVAGAAVVPTWLKGSPFRGLAAFQFEHAEIFHGRTRAIAEAKDRLQRRAAEMLGPDGKPQHGTAFLLITGMSGSGKSSLVRAGLIPALISPGAVEGIGFWRWATFRPSEAADPTLALVRSLYAERALPELASGDFTPEALADLLVRMPDQGIAPIKGALKRAAEALSEKEKLARVPQARLALLVDQLEEVFTDDRFSDQTKQTFAELLERLATSGFIWIVATLRSDFYPRVAELAPLTRLKDGNGTYDLIPPTGPEIAQMIRAPARAAGLTFEENEATGGLDDVLQQAAAKNPTSLPLLSFVLDELYEVCKDTRRLSFAAYDALGGLEGAIAKRAEDLFKTLPPAEQQALPALLGQLISISGEDGAATARTVLESQVARDAASKALVKSLVEARLLVSGGEGDHTVLRVTHEALLTRWPRAQKVIADNREFLQARGRLQADSERWVEENRNPEELLPSGKRLAEAKEVLLARRSEIDPILGDYIDASLAAEAARETAKQAEAKKKLKRTQMLAVAGLVLALVAGAGAYWGITGQQEAKEQAIEAENQRGIAVAEAERALRNEEIAKQKEEEARQRAQEVLQFQSKTLALESRRQSGEGNATVGMLLALEGLPKAGEGGERPYVAEAEAALKVSLAAQNGLVLFQHQKQVNKAVLSPDGKVVLTASADTTARLWDVYGAGEIMMLRGHTASVRDAAFSPDGSLIATVSEDGTARLWDRATGAALMTLTPEGMKSDPEVEGSAALYRVLFSPDGRLVMAEGYADAVLWDARSGRQLGVFGGHGASITRATFSPDGKLAATVGYDGYARLWDTATGQLTLTISDGTLAYNWIEFSPDGQAVLLADTNGNAEAWSTSDGSFLNGFYGRHEDGLSRAIYSPDGQYVATASYDGTVRLWYPNGSHIIALETSDLGVTDLAFSPDSQFLITVESDGRLTVWDSYSREKLTEIDAHKLPVNSVTFSADSARFLTASDDNTARLWQLSEQPAKAVLGWRATWVTAVEISPNGKVAALGHSNEGIVALIDMTDGSLLGNLIWHINEISDIDFSPDGKRLVTAALDYTVAVWDVENRTLISTLAHEGEVYGVSFSPDGKKIASAGGDGYVLVADAESGEILLRLGPATAAMRTVRWSADGTRLVAAGDDQLARVYDAQSGQQLALLEGHGSWMTDALFTPDGKQVVTAAGDGYAAVWDAATGELWGGLEADTKSAVWSVDVSPDGRYVAAATDNGAVIWQLSDGAEVARITGNAAPLKQVAFSPDSRRLLTTASDGAASIWSVPDGREITQLTGQSTQIYDAVWSRRGDMVLAGAEDGTAIAWNPIDGSNLFTFNVPVDQVWDVSFSPDGKYLASSGYVNLSIWDTATNLRVKLLSGHSDYIYRVDFSPDGRRLATASADGTVLLRDTSTWDVVSTISHYTAVLDARFSADSSRLVTVDQSGQVAVWTAEDGAEVSLLTGHSQRVNTGIFSPVDSNRVLTASDDGTARLWDATTGEQLLLLEGHKDWVNEAVFSPDGTLIATASSDGTARIWDAKSGALVHELTDHLGPLWALAFSPDGKYLATASDDATARIWDVASGKSLFILAAETYSVNKVAFSPEGDHVVTVSSDQTTRVWDTATGTLVSTLKGHGDIIVDVAFSPNGRLLATGAHDGRVRLWRIYTGRDLVSMARSMAPRSLTAEERERFSLPPE